MAVSISYSVEEFSKALESSFIQKDPTSDDRYTPRLLTNDKTSGANVLSVLKNELRDCVSFDFSVAFITSGGIQVLVELLADLEKRRIPGRILTSTYLNFNEPDALRKLLEYPNIEARVYQGDLHAKGYYFDKEGLSTVIIGSSNLTQTALTCNKEWNILFRSFSSGELYLDAREQFESIWADEHTTPITSTWIDEYEVYRCQSDQVLRRRLYQAFGSLGRKAVPGHAKTHGIVPNRMQEQALEALDVLHKREEGRALLISATGTGKTYLSAGELPPAFEVAVTALCRKNRVVSYDDRRHHVYRFQVDSTSIVAVLLNHESYGIRSRREGPPTGFLSTRTLLPADSLFP